MREEPPDRGDGEARRLRWRSRRGMLELELALAPFVEQRLERLQTQDKALYARLLEHDDRDIFDWIQGRREPADPDLAAIVAAIRDANAA